MSLRALLLGLLLLGAPPARALDWPPGGLLVLCYHDVVDNLRQSRDPTAVASRELAAQFAWLRGHGYTPVGLDDVLKARRGEKPLPERAVLLTFDDGYRSVYTRAFPLLKAFNFPAVVTLVGRWMDAAPGATISYGEGEVPREAFLSWAEVNEMVRSGLVEAASQTYDLHHGVPGNPQGNLQPAAGTRIYDAARGAYEDEAAHRARLRADLARAAVQIERRTGRPPRAIAWPYGNFGLEAAAIAAENGMTIGFSLEDGVNGPDQPVHALKRLLIVGFPTSKDLAVEIAAPPARAPLRTVRVELDALYSPDAGERERRLSRLLERIRELSINAVLLHATADTDGNGAADAAYFPNRHLPLRADLFNRTAWQILSRTGARVYARMPVLAFEHGPAPRADAKRASLPSPAAPETGRFVEELYDDLARHAHFQGLLFGADANAGASFELIERLTERVRAARYPLKTARELDAGILAAPAGPARFGETLQEYTRRYDWTLAVTPGPAGDAARFLEPLETLATQLPAAFDRTVIELFAGDPRTGSQVPAQTLAEYMRRFQRRGAIHFGYRTDDFLNERPAIEAVAPAMSLRAYPQERAGVR